MKQEDIDYIIPEYRLAKDRKEKVKILADMFCCSPDDIAQILLSNGFEESFLKNYSNQNSRKSHETRMNYSKEEMELIIKCVKSGLPLPSIVNEFEYHGFNRSYSSIFNKRKQLVENNPELVGREKYQNTNWTDEQISWIIERYPFYPNAALARMFIKQFNVALCPKTVEYFIRKCGKLYRLKKD